MKTKDEIEKVYDFSSELGKGTSGKVYLARHLHQKKFYAIKKIKLKKVKAHHYYKDYFAEPLIMKRLPPHRNIIKSAQEHFRTNKYLYLVMELMEGGDMNKVIRGHKIKGTYFEERVLWGYAW